MSVSDIITNPQDVQKLMERCSFESEQNIISGLRDIPEWLSKTYLENSLKTYYNDNKLHIKKMDARPALGKGENYGGVLTRIKADFINGAGVKKTGYYIIKTSYEGDAFAQSMMAPYDIFNREMSIYQNILPKLKTLLLEINNDEVIFADTMAVDYDRSALIFEDLNVRDFVMPDRLAGVDIDITKLVLRKLAKIHATSAVLNEREHGSLESYDRGMFNRYTDNYAACFVGLLEACSRRVAQWPDYTLYAQKLEALVPLYMELGKRVFDVNPGHINVLAHGDLWTNNVLVKYDKDSGKALDAIIIDFQYSAWGSPAIDLFYFLNSSLQPDIHLYQQQELIQYYYDIFAGVLTKLRYKSHIPSLHRFHLQLEEKAFYAFHTSCIVLPVQRNIETKDADFNALMETNERAIRFKNTCYKNPYCHKILRELLPKYERKGLLELNQ